MYLLAALVLVFLAALLLGHLLARRAYEEVADMQVAFASAEDPGLADLASTIDSSQVWLLTFALILVVPGALWLLSGSIVFALAAGGLLAMFPRWLLAWSNAQRRRKFERQLAETFAALASSLQAGLSLHQALDALVREAPQPTAYEFGLVTRKLRLGADFESAVSDLEERMAIENLKIGLTAIRISRAIGGNLVEIIQQLAHTIRRKEEMEGKIRSLTAQGRVQGLVMGGLPLLLMLVLYQLEPEAMGSMFTTPLGWVCLGIIVVMEYLGYLTIRRIVSIDV